MALIATLACEVHDSEERFGWTGFHRRVGGAGLTIGPYQGGHGCLVIPFGRGAEARTGRLQIVADATAVPDHIACSASNRSRLVIPFPGRHGAPIGDMDIDSDRPAAVESDDADAVKSVPDQVFAR